MTKKTIWDICGKDMPLEIYNRPIKDYKFCMASYGKVWDICNECRNELDDWMKNERQKVRDKECPHKKLKNG